MHAVHLYWSWCCSMFHSCSASEMSGWSRAGTEEHDLKAMVGQGHHPIHPQGKAEPWQRVRAAKNLHLSAPSRSSVNSSQSHPFHITQRPRDTGLHRSSRVPKQTDKQHRLLIFPRGWQRLCYAAPIINFFLKTTLLPLTSHCKCWELISIPHLSFPETVISHSGHWVWSKKSRWYGEVWKLSLSFSSLSGTGE